MLQGPRQQAAVIRLHERHHMRIDLTGDGEIDVVQPVNAVAGKITAHTAIHPAGRRHVQLVVALGVLGGQAHWRKQHRNRTGRQTGAPHQQVGRGQLVHHPGRLFTLVRCHHHVDVPAGALKGFFKGVLTQILPQKMLQCLYISNAATAQDVAPGPVFEGFTEKTFAMVHGFQLGIGVGAQHSGHQ